jgi:hypothetical protein
MIHMSRKYHILGYTYYAASFGNDERKPSWNGPLHLFRQHKSVGTLEVIFTRQTKRTVLVLETYQLLTFTRSQATDPRSLGYSQSHASLHFSLNTTRDLGELPVCVE